MHEELVARLRALPSLRDVPDAELVWLATHGETHHSAAGDELFPDSGEIDFLWIVLQGHVAIYVDRGAGPRKTYEWRTGDLSGVMPYSRMRTSPGRVVFEEDTDLLAVHSTHFPEMIRHCHELTAACVHAMLDRARHFTSSDLHEEKMLSLGKLAAGLAHELNNPASAATRSADELVRSVRDLETTAIALGAAGLTPSGYDLVARLRRAQPVPSGDQARSPLAQADWEDEVEAWLHQHGLPAEAADALADSSITLDLLEACASGLRAGQLALVLSWFVAGHNAQRLARDIEVATGRIYSLVAAVKGFTYMDQAAVPVPVNLARGLEDTLTVLRAKANAKSIALRLDVEPGLPPFVGFGGELNQVWSNLIDNALDALPTGGVVEVTVRRRVDRLVVCVADNGPGIPDAIRPRIFDPFFTTKPPGSGTGLGLDIVRRLVQRARGEVDVESRPGRTAFIVTLPLDPGYSPIS